MDLSTAIAIRTYGNEAVAQMAAMHLESVGIEAVIDADDCGGVRPELQKDIIQAAFGHTNEYR